MDLPHMYGPFTNSTFTDSLSISGAANSSTANNHILRQPSRPRVGPKGSKNKSLRSRNVTIHIPADKDVVQWLFQFCCQHKASLAVSSGSGHLSDAVILHGGQLSPTVGPFRIKSLSGTVTINSPKRFFPFQVILLGWDGQLCNQIMVGGTTLATVNVTAMMTVFENIENTPSSGNLSPRIMNVQSGECYNSVTTTPHLNNSMQLERVMTTETAVMNQTWLDDAEIEPPISINSPLVHNQKDEECDDLMMMKSKNDELDDDFWNSLNPIVDLSPFERV